MIKRRRWPLDVLSASAILAALTPHVKSQYEFTKKDYTSDAYDLHLEEKQELDDFVSSLPESLFERECDYESRDVTVEDGLLD